MLHGLSCFVARRIFPDLDLVFFHLSMFSISAMVVKLVASGLQYGCCSSRYHIIII